MKIVYKKIVAIALFALILFGTVSHAVPVKASPGDVQRKRSIPYSVLFDGATYSTGEYSMEDANGEIRTAYCIEANKKALGSGNYNYEEIDYSQVNLTIEPEIMGSKWSIKKVITDAINTLILACQMIIHYFIITF